MATTEQAARQLNMRVTGEFLAYLDRVTERLGAVLGLRNASKPDVMRMALEVLDARLSQIEGREAADIAALPVPALPAQVEAEPAPAKKRGRPRKVKE